MSEREEAVERGWKTAWIVACVWLVGTVIAAIMGLPQLGQTCVICASIWMATANILHTQLPDRKDRHE